MRRIFESRYAPVRFTGFAAELLAVGLSLLSATGLKAAELVAGPMVGHTTTSSARIWVETSQSADIRVDYWQEPRLLYDPVVKAPFVRGSATGRTTADYPHTGTLELLDLNLGWLIHYEVFVDGKAVRAIATQSFSLFPPLVPDPEKPDRIAEFSIAFGSCTFPARIPIQPIWAQVVRRRPMAFLFLGDNNYLPNKPENFETDAETTRYIMAYSYRSLRNVAGIREVMASTPSYGIWDDHDYGPGNSDRTFRWKQISLDVFHRYWPNSKPGNAAGPGIYFSFQIADVAFFLLDNRYHRDPNDAEDRETMLGAAQLSWLKERLKSSTATFKIVAHGGTVLVNDGLGKETWNRFGSERDDFLAWLFAEEITGVLFIAGDWHVGVLHRLFRPGDAYPLYELMSSNLAVKIIPRDRFEMAEGTSTNQWVSPFLLDYNFGMLRFSGKRGERKVTVQLIDESGAVRTELEIAEEQLRPNGR